MNTLKLIGLAGKVTVLAVLPVALALAVHAETSTPASPQTRSAPAPVPAQPNAAQKMSPDAAAPAPKSAEAAGAPASIANVTIGTAVFGTDGQQVGEVKGVKSEASGVVNEIHVKTSALVGLGGKIVVIPASKIAKGGQTIQLALKAEEVGKLPILVEGNSG